MMKRKLNVKLFLILLGASIATVSGIYFLHEFQVKRNASGLLVRASQAKEDGDLRSAVKFQRRYLQYQTNDYEQLAELALYMKEMIETDQDVTMTDVRRTYGTIAQAVLKLDELEASERDESLTIRLREASADLAIAFRRWNDAIEHLQFLVALKGQDAELEVKLARCYYANGDRQDAKAKLSELVGFDTASMTFSADKARMPEEVEAYYLLALIYRNEEQDDDTAEQVLAKMVELNSESSKAYLRRCQFWRLAGESEKDRAKQDIDRAIELGPEEADVVLVAAEMKLEDGELDSAKELLDGGLASHPDDGRFYRQLASWAWRRNDVVQAREFVKDGLERDPGEWDLVWYRATLEIQSNEIDLAEKSLADLKKLEAPREVVRVLEGKINIARRNWRLASQQLEEIRPSVRELRPNLLGEVDRFLALCYERLHQTDKQMEVYRRLILSDPNDLMSRWAEIQTLVGMGQVDAAVDRYERMRRHVELREIEVGPQYLVPHLQLRMAQQSAKPEEQRDWRQADQLLAEIKKQETISNVVKAEYESRLLRAKGENELADRVLDQIEQEHPDQLGVRLAKVDKALQKDGLDAALALLDQLQAENGDNVTLRVARARLYAVHGGSDASSQLAKLDQDTDSWTTDEKLALWNALAGLYQYQLQDRSMAQTYYKRVAEKRPRDVNLILRLFELAKESGDEAEVDSTLRKIEDLVGRDGSEYQVAEASRLLWHARTGRAGQEVLAEARRLLVEARKSRPDWDAVVRMEASIFAMDNDVDAAADVLRRAIQSGKSTPAIQRMLLHLLFDSGKLEEAEAVLQTIDPSQRTVLENRIARHLLGVKGGSTEDLVINVNSINPDDHLEDARLLILDERWEDAEQALHRAVNQGPNRPDTWYALVRFLGSRGRVAEAEEVVRRIQLELPESALPAIVGRCYEILGDREQASQFYMRAYNINPHDISALRSLSEFYLRAGATGQATRLAVHFLGALIAEAQNPQVSMHPNIVWARRTMATLLAQSRSFTDFTNALGLIEANVPEGTRMTSEDLVLWAKISASRDDVMSRQRAIEQMEETASSRPLNDSEQFVLAELYEKNNRWPDCQKLMTELLQRNPQSVALVQAWAGWLLERDQTDEVIPLLKTLDSETSLAKQLRAHVLARRGRVDDVKRLLSSMIKKPLPPEENRTLLELAQLTEQLAEHSPGLEPVAEGLYRQYVKREPKGKLLLANYLARHGDGDKASKMLAEAFQIGDQAIEENLPVPSVVQHVGLSAMNNNLASVKPEAPWVQKIKQWIEIGKQRDPSSQALTVMEAQVAEISESMDVAEGLYRRYLERSDLGSREAAVASNNLAFVLALQGEGDESLSLVERAINELGPVGDVVDTRGVVYLARNEPRKAIEDFQQVIAGGGDTPVVLFHLAQAQHKAGDVGAARETLNRAKERGLTLNSLRPVERELLKRLVQDLGGDMKLTVR